MSYVRSAVCSISEPDWELATPTEISEMSVEIFDKLSYREQLTIKRKWPDDYNRLVGMERKSSEECDHK